MADQPQTAEQQPPAYFKEFAQQLAQQQHQTAQQIQQIGGAVQQLAQHQAQGARPAPPRPNPENVREQLLTTIVNEPDRYSAELVGLAKNSTMADVQRLLAEERAKMQAERDAETFWATFFQYHPDLSAVENEVFAAFQRMDPSAPANVRADLAAAEARKRRDASAQYQQQADQRQRDAQRMVAGAPGYGMGRGPASARQDDEVVTTEESTKRWLEMQRAAKQKRMAHNVFDAEYNERAQARRQVG
jgi:hypothetical protein